MSGAAMPLPMFPDQEEQVTPSHLVDQPKVPRRRRSVADTQALLNGNPPLAEDVSNNRGPAADAENFDLHLLGLANVKGIGLHALRALVDAFNGDLARVWQEDTPTLGDILARARVRDARKAATDIANGRDDLLAAADNERSALAANGTHLLAMRAPGFPEALAALPDPPYWLFVEGQRNALTANAHVAIVGTRDATTAGAKTAERLAHFVVSDGLTIVSGLAEGIDTAAHRVAAYYAVPQVAVLGTGIRQVFPASTKGLRRRIVAAGGAVITEYLPNENYGKANFVQRNRLQAGLASAVCPVEGRLKSGTAHTVNFAERYGRKLFGVYRTELATSNELPAHLAHTGRPVFDLDSDSGVAELREFLRSIEGRRAPIPSRPAPESLFHNVLAAMDELAADVAITPFDAKWLLGRIANRFGLRYPDPDGPGLSNGH